MRWLRSSLSRWRRRADRVRPVCVLRRAAFEPLESRRLLATLDLDVQLYADNSGTRGAPLSSARVGETLFLSVTTEDQRTLGTPAGVIALPLDLQWRDDILRYPSGSATPPTSPATIPVPPPTVPNAVVTASFPLQRSVSEFNVDDAADPHSQEILGLRGASLPAAGLGQAIGKLPPDPLAPAASEFSLIHFEAVGAGLTVPFQMTLAGSMSFADGARLDGIADANQNDPLTVTRYLRVQAVVAGRKFEDRDYNGQPDAGDAGIEGWRIGAYLDQNGDGVLQQSEFLAGAVPQDGSPDGFVTTGADGRYQLALDTAAPAPGGACPAGTPQAYIVVEVRNDDWTQSYPRESQHAVLAPGLDTGSIRLGDYGYAVTIQPCDPNSGLDDLDFGNSPEATKSGVKYEDTNGNGVRDAGEPGRLGWAIRLTGTDGLGNAVDRQTTTDSDGAYSFRVPPGTYIVYEALIGDHWHQSAPQPGTGIVTAPNGTRGYQITLTSGETDAGNDFGNYCDSTAKGVKFDDRNGNGVKDTGEPGLSGWTIQLTGSDGLGNSVQRTATTDADGSYTFSVPPGTYTVYEALLDATWTQSSPLPGAGIVTAPNGTRGYQLTLASCGVTENRDFGNFRDGSVGGVKFNDENGNGIKDTDESLLPDWTIRLNGIDGLGNAVTRVAQTNAQGRYSFAVPPGVYSLHEELPTGWVQTAPPAGTYTVTLVSGQFDDGKDFGNRRILGSLSGFVYADVDADGRRDVDAAGAPIELGLPQVEIALWRAGQLVQTDLTGPDGWYHFEDLEPGTYDLIQTTQPACFLDGSESVGIVLPGREARGTAGADRITGIAIGADEHGIDYNFGELGLRAACVNKRMVFGSATPRQATVYEPLDVSSAVVRGTSGADQIDVQAVGGAVQVTVNGGPVRSFATADTKIVTIDAGAGRDTVTYAGSAASEVLRTQPSYAAVRDEVASPLPAGGTAVVWNYAVEAAGAERVEATSGGDAGRAVLQDSPHDDQLAAVGDSATLTTDAELDLLARAVAFERVRAIAAAGGADEANQTPPLGYDLDLVGDWL